MWGQMKGSPYIHVLRRDLGEKSISLSTIYIHLAIASGQRMARQHFPGKTDSSPQNVPIASEVMLRLADTVHWQQVGNHKALDFHHQ